jgi:hypothetical protein
MSLSMTYTVTDILTGLLVLVTAFYAWATLKILRANESVVRVMREQVEALNRPYVRIAPLVRTGTQMLELSIKNIGRSPANDLRLVLSHDFFQYGEGRPDRNLAKFSAFTEQIDSLPPDAELRFALGVGAGLLGSSADPELTPKVFAISATYGFGVTRYSESTSVDLRPFDLSLVTHDPVANEINKLRESIERLWARKNGL